MWVKICANTNVEDALLSASLGADALGFVFAASTRRVTPAQVAAISAALPDGVERVGVFHSGTADEIADAAREARLHTVQWHADFDEAFSARLRAAMLPTIDVIQTVHWSVGDQREAEALAEDRLTRIARELPGSRVLLDAKVGAATGGTGVSFDWTRAARLFAAFTGLRMIIAGGLKPENVVEAISALRPWGVDVASGTEHIPGRKDPEKVRAFIENARGAL